MWGCLYCIETETDSDTNAIWCYTYFVGLSLCQRERTIRLFPARPEHTCKIQFSVIKWSITHFMANTWGRDNDKGHAWGGHRFQKWSTDFRDYFCNKRSEYFRVL